MKSITELRKERGLTQTELAKLSGISVPELSDIESGKRRPRATTTLKLAKALKVSYEEIERNTK